jgi:hypothetical protein
LADFVVTGSVAAVIIDEVVAMSSEPEDKELTFTSVDMPSVASLVTASESSSIPDKLETRKSSSPVIGFGPPLTEGFLMQVSVASMKPLAGFTGALILVLDQLYGGYVGNKLPLLHKARPSLNCMQLLKFPNLSNCSCLLDGRHWSASISHGYSGWGRQRCCSPDRIRRQGHTQRAPRCNPDCGTSK